MLISGSFGTPGTPGSPGLPGNFFKYIYGYFVNEIIQYLFNQ